MDVREAVRRLTKRVPHRGVAVVESINGHCNIGCEGDSFEVLNAIANLLDGFARHIGEDYEEVVEACNELRAIGFKEFVERYRDNEKKPIYYQGIEIGTYDPSMEKTAEEKCKALETEINTLKAEKTKLENELMWRNGSIANLKIKFDELQKTHDKHVKDLQKEIKAEQHKNYEFLALQKMTPQALRQLAEEMERASEEDN